jgi:hypothetical protein
MKKTRASSKTTQKKSSDSISKPVRAPAGQGRKILPVIRTGKGTIESSGEEAAP